MGRSRVTMPNTSHTVHRAFVALAVCYVSLAIIGGVRFYSAVPWLDAWDGYLNFYMIVSSGDWSAWWAQHNEHRILLSRLFFWLDITFFKGSGIFLIVINYLLVTVEFIVLYLCLKERLLSASSEQTDAKLTRQLLALMMLATSFSWMHRVNLVWGFQSQFFLAQLLPLLAFYLLHKSHTSCSRSTPLFVLASLAGVASLGTMANGILTLPLMVVFAAMLRMNSRRIVILIGFAAAGISAYFYDYKFPAMRGTPMATLLYEPLEFLQYVLFFLGSPFYHIAQGSELIAQIAALFLMASALFFAGQALRRPEANSLQLSLLTFILYVCTSAVVAAGSRVHSAGVEQALTARYTTSTIVAWLALLILYAPAIHHKIIETRSRILWYLLCITLLLMPMQVKAMRSVADRNAKFNLAALALTLGIKDTPAIHFIYPDVKRVSIIAAKAADKKLSIFGLSPFNEVRQALGQIEQKRSSVTCSGELQKLTRITDDSRYYRVRGWLETADTSQEPAMIRLLDQQGRVVGFALSGFARADSEQENNFYPLHSSFIGYVQAEQANKNIILNGKKPDCELLVMASLPADQSTIR